MYIFHLDSGKKKENEAKQNPPCKKTQKPTNKTKPTNQSPHPQLQNLLSAVFQCSTKFQHLVVLECMGGWGTTTKQTHTQKNPNNTTTTKIPKPIKAAPVNFPLKVELCQPTFQR